MMSHHLDDDEVQRLLHGETPRDGEPYVYHLGECMDCRRRYEVLEREEHHVQGLLQLLDHPRPEIALNDVLTRADASSDRPVRWAAGVVFVLGMAGAAYAATVVPQSPIAGWPAGVRAWFTSQSAPLVPSASRDGSEDRAGIAVSPGERLVIAFAPGGAGGEARVELTDDIDVTITSPQRAATFFTGEGRVGITVARAASIDVRIPRSAPHVEVHVGDRSVLQTTHGRVRAASAPVDGVYRLPLTRIER